MLNNLFQPLESAAMRVNRSIQPSGKKSDSNLDYTYQQIQNTTELVRRYSESFIGKNVQYHFFRIM